MEYDRRYSTSIHTYLSEVSTNWLSYAPDILTRSTLWASRDGETAMPSTSTLSTTPWCMDLAPTAAGRIRSRTRAGDALWTEPMDIRWWLVCRSSRGNRGPMDLYPTGKTLFPSTNSDFCLRLSGVQCFTRSTQLFYLATKRSRKLKIMERLLPRMLCRTIATSI